MKLTIEVTEGEIELIKRCWLRPLAKCVDYLDSHPDTEAGEHAKYEIEPLYVTENIRNKLYQSFLREKLYQIEREVERNNLQSRDR